MADHAHHDDTHDEAHEEEQFLAAPRLPEGTQAWGLVGRFESPGELYHACEQLRDGGFKFDAHSPFPVHGLDEAMGNPPTKLPWIVLGGAFTGGIGALLLQWWVHSVEYPQVISGKPMFAYQAYVPVTFELTILLTAFATFFGMWGLCRLPQLFHPTFQHPTFHRFSDDGFFVSVEAGDNGADLERARALLESLGAKEIMEVAP